MRKATISAVVDSPEAATDIHHLPLSTLLDSLILATTSAGLACLLVGVMLTLIQEQSEPVPWSGCARCNCPFIDIVARRGAPANLL